MLQPPSNNVPSSGNKPSSLGYLFLLISRPLKQLAQCSWVLIANTSTLPRVGIFLGLNKGLPVERQRRFDKSWASGEFLFEFVVKGLVTAQFHLVRIVGGTDTWASHQANEGFSTPSCHSCTRARVSSAGNSVRAIVDM